jgi:tRNA-dihydrouridine synthase A
MMDVTDRHFRFMMRMLTKRTRLYTEMVVDGTIIHAISKRQRFLDFDPVEHPVAIQLGGNNPESLAAVTE